jgi:hypothetical protein
LRQPLGQQDVPGIVDDEAGYAIETGQIDDRDEEDDYCCGDGSAA